MCGIAGVFDPRPGGIPDRTLLERMAMALAHRGPDGQGVHVAPHVGLAHRRLAIIDLEGGIQPFVSEDGRHVISFNGEIYNFQDVRLELEAQGRRFRTRSDTEVVLQAWAEWGPACLKRLRGMFAFAIWDEDRKQLCLARDRFGIKPLYYSRLPDGRLVFASELKGLLPLGSGLPRRLREDAVADFFTLGYVPEPKTILEGTHRLEAGEYLVIDARTDTPRKHRYWDVTFGSANEKHGAGALDGVSDETLQQEVLDRLGESVRAHLVADVPVSTFLSGGVDSSAVVLSASSVMSQRLSAYSIGFETREHDETDFARQVARIADVEHHVQPVHLAPQQNLAAVLRSYDEPFADSSAIPTHELCRVVAAHCKVALSGDGGDEVFAGYSWYATHSLRLRYLSLMPRPVRQIAAKLAAKVAGPRWPMPYRPPGMGFIVAGGDDVARGYLMTQSLAPWLSSSELLHPGFRKRVNGYDTADLVRGLFSSAPTDDPVHQAQYVDFKLYLPSDILTKVDRASMAHSLEVRVPFLDHVLIDWVLSLGSDRLMRGGAKGLLRRSLSSALPDGVLNRRKQGFSVPLDAWFRRDLGAAVESLLERTEHADLWRIVDARQVRRIVSAHRSGRIEAGRLLWAVLAFATSLVALDVEAGQKE